MHERDNCCIQVDIRTTWVFDTFIVCLLMNVYLYISEIEAIEVLLYIELFLLHV